MGEQLRALVVADREHPLHDLPDRCAVHCGELRAWGESVGCLLGRLGFLVGRCHLGRGWCHGPLRSAGDGDPALAQLLLERVGGSLAGSVSNPQPSCLAPWSMKSAEIGETKASVPKSSGQSTLPPVPQNGERCKPSPTPLIP